MAETLAPASRNKANIKEELRQFMLSVCDEDIKRHFSPHYYTIEPLLMQLIRELRKGKNAD